MKPDWVLITGASSGIGAALAEVFAGHGHDLVLTARDGARLEAVRDELRHKHGVAAEVVAKDLSNPAGAGELFEALQRRKCPVSILVNNAGWGRKGPFVESDLAAELDMIEVNVLALVRLTRLFVQPMLAHGAGRILNVASTAAFQPGPLMATYYATKSFVHAFSYALGSELSGSGVTVTTVYPGPTRTAFHARAGTAGSEALTGKWMMEPQQVAQCAYAGLMRGQRIVIPGFMNKLLHVLARLVPTSLGAAAARRVIES